jgi:hypothetical protein
VPEQDRPRLRRHAISFGIFGFSCSSMMVLRPEGFLPNAAKLELHRGASRRRWRRA